jgi:hypothetical protein
MADVGYQVLAAVTEKVTLEMHASRSSPTSRRNALPSRPESGTRGILAVVQRLQRILKRLAGRLSLTDPNSR